MRGRIVDYLECKKKPPLTEKRRIHLSTPNEKISAKSLVTKKLSIAPPKIIRLLFNTLGQCCSTGRPKNFAFVLIIYKSTINSYKCIKNNQIRSF